MQVQVERSESNSETRTKLHLGVVAYDALTPADMWACMFHGLFALHMLTFSLSIASDKRGGCFQLHCGMHTEQSLTSALLHFISVACAASLQCSPVSNLSFPVARVKLSIPECSVFPATHIPPASASYLCASILPLLYSSASLFSSLSPAVEIQRANPDTCGIPPSPPVMMYIRVIASEQPYRLAHS